MTNWWQQLLNGIWIREKKVSDMTADEIWMRDPIEQCKEEFMIYREISELVFDKLMQIRAGFIVAEGAAFTPEVMARIGYAKKQNQEPKRSFFRSL